MGPGKQEAYSSLPFYGPSGWLLDRCLSLIGQDRDDVRVHNVIQCQPPNDYLEGAPWERSAVSACRQYLEPTLAEGHKVVIAMGGVAMRALLGLPRAKGVTVDYFHGAVLRDPTDRFWVVPTYHPAFLLRGNHKYMGVLLFDLKKAFQVAAGKWEPDEPNLVVDPPVEWFEQWIRGYLLTQDRCWLSIDIETQEKAEQEAEDELEPGRRGAVPILRINFSCSTSEGITVPWVEPYLSEIRRVLSFEGVKVVWNGAYDLPILAAHGFQVSGPVYDAMWMFHVLQSDVPKSLGFVTPLYSRSRPWKHLARTEPGIYGAYDGVNQLRCAYGVAADLQRLGMWRVFERHVHRLDTVGLRPAETVGLLADRQGLESLGQDLSKELERLDGEIQALVPTEAMPIWAPTKHGWAKTPSVGALAKVQEEDKLEAPPEVISKMVATEVLRCKLCGLEGVTKAHNCQKKAAGKPASKGARKKKSAPEADSGNLGLDRPGLR